MKLAMIGCGYVGLVTGACFADAGHTVTCVDVDAEKIGSLNRNEIPIYEPGLDAVVERNVVGGRMKFTTRMQEAVKSADIVFIAVGTPSRRGDGFADLAYVYDAARQIARALTGYTIVVTKSTVPVGTGDEVERIIREERPEAEFDVVSNPEFLREGSAIVDFVNPDRVVIGTSSGRPQKAMGELYQSLSANGLPIFFTDRRSSELIKYAANSFLAMKVTFINEIADLCEKVGANIQDIANGIGMDKRIGSQFLGAGPGYGGSCFPKDTLALVKTAHDAEMSLRLVEATVTVNGLRKRAMGRKVVAACDGDVRHRKITVLGLTFKPDTDDTRDSPSIDIVRSLQDAGAQVTVYDPLVRGAHEAFENVVHAADPYEACAGARAVVVVTEWKQFKDLDLQRVKDVMFGNVLVDLRNIFDATEAQRAGFRYVPIGKPADPRGADMHPYGWVTSEPHKGKQTAYAKPFVPQPAE